jgi:hypothetical protein
MGNNMDWSKSGVGRMACCDRPARVRITAGRDEGREGERGESSWYQRKRCRRKGRHSWVANTVEVMAEGEGSAKVCSSYLNVEWRALRPVMADGPERGVDARSSLDMSFYL